MTINNQFKEIDEEYLLSLIANQVQESKTIEYKRDLPGNSLDDRKEFLADISSFANSSGGNIIYGVIENEGIPTELSGLGNIDLDAEKLRMENLLRDCIEPRIPNFKIIPITLQESTTAIIIKVPRSWA